MKNKVLMCANCKNIYIAPIEQCECGSKSFVETHESNREFAKNITKVKFYLATYEPYEADEQPTREVLAVFVDEVQGVINGERYFLSYAQIGQHSECSESFLRENCREINKKEDYLDLFNELTNVVGYQLNVL